MPLLLGSVSACAMRFRGVSPSAVSSAVFVVSESLGAKIGWLIGVGDHRAVCFCDAYGVSVVD